MSYSTIDRFGSLSTTYVKGGAPVGGTGLKSWWPDFGPGCQDFSQQPKGHPSESIFASVVEPMHWSHEARRPPPAKQNVAEQFRNPAPARHAMLHRTEPEVGHKLAQHHITKRQSNLHRLELRAKRMDSWVGDAPIRMSAEYLENSKRLGGSRSLSEPSVGALSSEHASAVSRDVYEKHGWLVGRHQGSVADSRTGEASRRRNPSANSAMLLSGDLQDSTRPRRKPLRKPAGQWRICPEKSFVFDPATCLPMPRGGWDSNPDPLALPSPASSRTRSASGTARSVSPR